MGGRTGEGGRTHIVRGTDARCTGQSLKSMGQQGEILGKRVIRRESTINEGFGKRKNGPGGEGKRVRKGQT